MNRQTNGFKIPEIELTALTNALLAHLRTHANEHRSTFFRLEPLDDIEFNKGYIDGVMYSVDEEAKSDFPTGDLATECMNLLTACHSLGHPLHMIAYQFTLENGEWRYHITVESSAEHRAIEAERSALDQQIKQLLSDMIETDKPTFRRISCGRRDTFPKQAFAVWAFYSRERTTLQTTPALDRLIDQVYSFYERHGKKVLAVKYTLEPQTAETPWSVNIYHV